MPALKTMVGRLAWVLVALLGAVAFGGPEERPEDFTDPTSLVIHRHLLPTGHIELGPRPTSMQ